MATTSTRSRLILTAAGAATVLALSVTGCTTVTPGVAMAGDRGPCTHVDAPMLDVPAASDTEPAMRIPQPRGWEPDAELADVDASIRLALSTTDENAVGVLVQRVADADAESIFDDFHTGLMESFEKDGLHPDLTRTAGTLCGLPSERITVAGAGVSMGDGVNSMPDGPETTLLVAAESGGDTYLIAMVQTIDPDNASQQRDAETILTGFEVLPVAASTQT